MSIIEFHKTSKHFGDLKVLDEVDLAIEEGEVVVLIGPSGSGKSTLLRCINGLEQITGGDLIVDGISVRAGGRKLRQIRQEAGMVFQQFNLFPQMTALQNVAFGPRKVRDLSRAEAEAQALALLEKVGLKERAHHVPSALSGGQQQRVAIARALAGEPRLLLADEPTGNLDPSTALKVMDVLVRQVREHATSVVLVTHSETAAARADRVLHLTADGIRA